MSLIVDPTRPLNGSWAPGSYAPPGGVPATGRPSALNRPTADARPSWVRRAVSSAGNAPTAFWAGAEAIVLAEPHLHPLRGTIKGRVVAGGYWGLTLAVSTAIAM